MPRLLISAVALLASAALLTGCVSALIPDESSRDTAGSPGASAPADSAAVTIDESPATGEVLSGDGYSLTAPEGWTQPSADQVPAGVDVVAVDMGDTDGFSDNLNVVPSPAGLVPAALIKSSGPKEIEAAGGTVLATVDGPEVAGGPTVHLSAQMEQGGVEYLIEQYALSSDDQTYVVTFSFSSAVPESDRIAVAESVLVTWAWV